MRKTCRDCGAALPADTHYFNRNLSHKDGLSSYCKDCDIKRGHRRWKRREPAPTRFPIVADAVRRPPSGLGTGDNVCLRCSDLAECQMLARQGVPVKCEAKDTWDALREGVLRADEVSAKTLNRRR